MHSHAHRSQSLYYNFCNVHSRANVQAREIDRFDVWTIEKDTLTRTHWEIDDAEIRQNAVEKACKKEKYRTFAVDVLVYARVCACSRMRACMCEWVGALQKKIQDFIVIFTQLKSI